MKPGFETTHLELIKKFVHSYFPNAEILIFGSRISKNYKETSDLDLCIKGTNPLNLANWSKLESDLVQSNLPFKVDLVDWHRISDEFKVIIKNHHHRLF